MRILFLLLFFFPVLVLAQVQPTKNIQRQDLLWVRYQNQLTISPKLLLQTEIDNRMFHSPMKQHHLVMRTQGRYMVAEHLQAGLGITYALQYPQDPRSTSDLVVPELRVQHDITLKQKLGKANLNHRYMLEERFIRKVEEQDLLPGYNFNFRFRYRLQVEVPLVKKETEDLGLVVYDEAMLNFGKTIGKNVFDQNRMYAGVKWGVTEALALELGYLYWFQQRSSGVDFYSREIARLSIYHKVTLKRNDK
ncbi:DUF2490 domain-containing protein [Pontibacter qinzhouensis]|nr:DUF2490 domain-containing protein [Pontibacter qinzhouensis]